ncbi:MAG: DUF1343 domain-containing protein, partial [Prevotella sp.]|nr:DUF1343 domain-containing protein [Prevotella sp.]
MKRLINITLLFLCTLVINAQDGQVITGAESINEYFPLIKGKRVALVSNHTGMIKDQHVVDILVKENVNVTAIFSPEHGFRGNADAGEHVASSVDKKTGIPIRSLYDGKSRKPSKQS